MEGLGYHAFVLGYVNDVNDQTQNTQSPNQQPCCTSLILKGLLKKVNLI